MSDHTSDFEVTIFRTRILVTEATQKVFPVSNQLGTDLLSTLIEERLLSAGVEIETFVAAGELNYCVGLLHCKPSGLKGAEIIRKTLSQFCINSPIGEVFVHDARELIFRPYGSESLEKFTLDDLLGVSKNQAEKNVAILADIFSEDSQRKAIVDQIREALDKL
jgi:hypothetical protein